jgi:hypothetical protein
MKTSSVSKAVSASPSAVICSRPSAAAGAYRLIRSSRTPQTKRGPKSPFFSVAEPVQAAVLATTRETKQARTHEIGDFPSCSLMKQTGLAHVNMMRAACRVNGTDTTPRTTILTT